MSRLSLRAVWITAATVLLASLPVFSDSQVRAVRLSYVEGGVQIARSSGQEFDRAMLNLPIAQGAALRTSQDGRAEVEFEDGSTMRLAPNSSVEFPQLVLRDSGGKASSIEVSKGTVYVDFSGEKKDEFVLQFGKEKIALTRSARLRIGVADDGASVAVFKGDVQIEGPSATLAVKKNQTGTFDFANNDQAQLVKDIEEFPLDAWDKQQSDYHVRYASNSNQSYSPYSYGTADLAYYGNFFNAPGYGMLWQPYFVGAGWDPFMDGAWAFYPGWGFGWVSAYPWGWTPYHYGTWIFVPAYGWAWQPGGAWTGWYAQPRLLNPPSGFVAPKAPTTGNRTLMVNRGTGSTTTAGNKVVIRSNSAGLGIPRGQVNNLAKASQQVQTKGTVTERVHAAPVPAMTRPASNQTGMGSGSRPSHPTAPSMPSASSPRSAPSSHPAPSPRPAPAPSPSVGRPPR
jgi:FecR protein